jgi:hypothetical protein
MPEALYRSRSAEGGSGLAVAAMVNVMFWGKNILEWMFFTGLIGCVSVVLLSWISILKSAFSESDED